MATNQNLMRGFQVNNNLLTTGAVLTGIGAVIGVTGTVMVCVALVSAGRGWVHQMETAPTELAARTLHQAKVASMAGLDAWRTEAHNSAN